MGNPSPISETVSVNTPLSAALVQNADQAVPIAVPPTASPNKQRGYNLDGWRSIPNAVTLPIRRITDMDIEVQHMHFQPPAISDEKVAASSEAEPIVEASEEADVKLMDELDEDDDDFDPPILDGKHFTFHKRADAEPMDSTRSVMTITTVASTTAAVSTAVATTTIPSTTETAPAEAVVLSEASAAIAAPNRDDYDCTTVEGRALYKAARIAAYIRPTYPPNCTPDDVHRWKLVLNRQFDVEDSWSDPEFDEEFHKWICKIGRDGQVYKRQINLDAHSDSENEDESIDLWHGGNKKKRAKRQRQRQNNRQPRR